MHEFFVSIHIVIIIVCINSDKGGVPGYDPHRLVFVTYLTETRIDFHMTCMSSLSVFT